MRRILISIGIVFLVLLSISFSIKEEVPKNENIEKLEVKFYDDRLFFDGVIKTKDKNLRFDKPIVGGVIPHHLLPSFILSDFFERLKIQNPQVIILIGPNHYEKGGYSVLTSKFAWSTKFGEVFPSVKHVDELVYKNLAKTDEETLKDEHSVSGIMPYIKFYLPKAEVVPLVISSKITEQEIDALSSNLAAYVNQETVVIASVDFSHYLTNPVAKEKDKKTLQVMKSFDYNTLYTLNNDYLDSPKSIGLLFNTMEKLGNKDFIILYNTNSGELEKNNFIQTTSYFSIIFPD